MTKPLSEQVAELEKERDRLKADAISDLIKRHWLENQVRNREAERDDLQRQVQEARDEAAALRAWQGRRSQASELYDDADDDFPCCSSQPTSYADEDHQDAEIIDWHKPHRVVFQRASDTEAIEDLFHGRPGRIIPAPRLTVHDLEVAPAGSVLKHRSFYFVKRKGGDWSIPEFMDSSDPKETTEHLIKMGWDDATLTTPEEA